MLKYNMAYENNLLSVYLQMYFSFSVRSVTYQKKVNN
jgi:hypothetical protein